MCLFLLAKCHCDPVCCVSRLPRSPCAPGACLFDLESSPVRQEARTIEGEVWRFFEFSPPFGLKKAQDEEEMPLGEREACLFQLELPTDETEMCLFEVADTPFPLEVRLFVASPCRFEGGEPPPSAEGHSGSFRRSRTPRRCGGRGTRGLLVVPFRRGDVACHRFRCGERRRGCEQTTRRVMPRPARKIYVAFVVAHRGPRRKTRA
jgi:hypothetical protein